MISVFLRLFHPAVQEPTVHVWVRVINGSLSWHIKWSLSKLNHVVWGPDQEPYTTNDLKFKVLKQVGSGSEQSED